MNGAQPSETPVPGDPEAFSEFRGQQEHMQKKVLIYLNKNLKKKVLIGLERWLRG